MVRGGHQGKELQIGQKPNVWLFKKLSLKHRNYINQKGQTSQGTDEARYSSSKGNGCPPLLLIHFLKRNFDLSLIKPNVTLLSVAIFSLQ